MSALAIRPMSPSQISESDPRDDRAPDFRGTLQAARRPASDAPQRATIQPRRDRGPAPKPKAVPPDDAPAPQAQPQAQIAAPVQASAVDDVVAMISAGKSLVGAVASVVDPQVAAIPDEATALEATTAVANASDALPMTPLEQAVHDLIDRLREDSDKAPSQPHGESPKNEALPGMTMASVSIDDPASAKQIEMPQPVREAPEAQLQSHVHLVIDDGERLVLTVAVRGDQVVAHVRGDNEATAAALARNAGVLDDAMRARGLNLAELQTGHDHAQPQQRQQQQHAQREQAQPAFKLEENL